MSDNYVEEACFYLAEQKLPLSRIARAFELSTKEARSEIASYRKKIERGEVKYEDETKEFWTKNYREYSGDERVTLVDDKGRYYHGWKSELEKLGSEKVVELLVINKEYANKHPLSEFSKGQAVVGYDPLVPLRNIRRTVSLLEEILQEKEHVSKRRKKKEEK